MLDESLWVILHDLKWMFRDITLVMMFDPSHCPPIPPRKDSKSAFGSRGEETHWDCPFVLELVDEWALFKKLRRSECPALNLAGQAASEGTSVNIDARSTVTAIRCHPSRLQSTVTKKLQSYTFQVNMPVMCIVTGSKRKGKPRYANND